MKTMKQKKIKQINRIKKSLLCEISLTTDKNRLEILETRLTNACMAFGKIYCELYAQMKEANKTR